MDSRTIEILFRKFLDNRCTPEDAQILFDYLKKAEYDETFKEIIEEIEWQPDKERPLIQNEALDEVYTRLEASTKPDRRFPFSSIAKFAAVVVGILLISVFAIYQTKEGAYIEKAVPYGKMLKLQLPDNSVVNLNANSKIRYSSSMHKKDQAREVWLEGEAYFDVQKQDEMFIVHTGSMDVEVLGTAFNVNTRRSRTKVVLERGEVKLNIKEIENRIYMKPGELVEYDTNENDYAKETVVTHRFTSWRNNQLVYDATPLYQIANQLEDLYGMKIKFKDQALKHQIFTGTYPFDEPSLVIKAISRAFDLKMKKENNYIVFESGPGDSE